MTSQPGKQTITIHILPKSQEVKAIRQWNSVSKKNISWEIFFFTNHAESEIRETSSSPIFNFQENLWSKSKWSAP